GISGISNAAQQVASNTLQGGTIVNGGYVVVGDSNAHVNVMMGTGDLALNDLFNDTTTNPDPVKNLNNGGVTLNNVFQTIGNLSSSFVAPGGYKASMFVTLNGKAVAGQGTVLTINEPGVTTFGIGAQSTATNPETAKITGFGSVIMNSTHDGLT